MGEPFSEQRGKKVRPMLPRADRSSACAKRVGSAVNLRLHPRWVWESRLHPRKSTHSRWRRGDTAIRGEALKFIRPTSFHAAGVSNVPCALSSKQKNQCHFLGVKRIHAAFSSMLQTRSRLQYQRGGSRRSGSMLPRTLRLGAYPLGQWCQKLAAHRPRLVTFVRRRPRRTLACSWQRAAIVTRSAEH